MPRAAAAERQPDLRTRLGLGSGRLGDRRRRAGENRHGKNEQNDNSTDANPHMTLLARKAMIGSMRLAWRRWQPHGKKRNRAQNDRDDDEDQRVGGGDAKKKAGYKARQRYDPTPTTTPTSVSVTLTDDHVLHRSRRRAERQPDADLLRPLLH